MSAAKRATQCATTRTLLSNAFNIDNDIAKLGFKIDVMDYIFMSTTRLSSLENMYMYEITMRSLACIQTYECSKEIKTPV